MKLTHPRLQTLEGDWHEFESKALRKENEKRDKEARRAVQKEAAREKERKRPPSDSEAMERDAKRVQTMPPPPLPEKEAL
jgi:CTD kinase subunit alpha